MAYTCNTCGAVAKEAGHLCNPCNETENCEFCFSPRVDGTHMCKDKLAAMQYSCDSCGRVAMDEDYLCKPTPIS